MVNTELSDLIREIQGIRLHDELSDEAVIALSRSYVSMQNLVVTNSLDPEYGNRDTYEQALDALYRICVRRCRPGNRFERRCRMTPVLYMIVYLQMRGIDMRKSRECNELMRQLVEEWTGRTDAQAGRTAIYGVLRCIANCYCDAADEIRSTKSDFLLFKQQVSDWAARMDEDGHWAGISSREALCRLEVMSCNSTMFLDTRYDEQIEKSRTAYCRSILETLHRSGGAPLRNCGMTLFLLYEVMMWGVGTANYEWVNAIAVAAERQAAQYPYGSDEWLLYQSTVLDRLCMQAAEAVRERMLANIA